MQLTAALPIPLTVLAGLGAAVLIYFLVLLARNEAVFFCQQITLSISRKKPNSRQDTSGLASTSDESRRVPANSPNNNAIVIATSAISYGSERVRLSQAFSSRQPNLLS
jgi:hypothetical protein